MLWGERFTRRRVLVGILVVFALADAALAFVVMQCGRRRRRRAARCRCIRSPATSARRHAAQRLHGRRRASSRRSGTSRTARALRSRFALVDEVYGDGADPACHRVTHIIGAASLARFEGNVTRTLGAGRADLLVRLLPRGPRAVARQSEVAQARRLAAVARDLCSDSRLTPWVVYDAFTVSGTG